MAFEDDRDQRRHERYACKVKITYTVLSSKDATPMEYGVTYSRDLSAGGVCLYVDREIAAPVLMQLNLAIPVRPHHLLVLGKALRCRRCEENDLFEVGVKFVGILPPNFRELLRESMGTAKA